MISNRDWETLDSVPMNVDPIPMPYDKKGAAEAAKAETERYQRFNEYIFGYIADLKELDINFKVTSNAHDFGMYYTLRVYFEATEDIYEPFENDLDDIMDSIENTDQDIPDSGEVAVILGALEEKRNAKIERAVQREDNINWSYRYAMFISNHIPATWSYKWNWIEGLKAEWMKERYGADYPLPDYGKNGTMERLWPVVGTAPNPGQFAEKRVAG